jgi:hypothetical protein
MAPPINMKSTSRPAYRAWEKRQKAKPMGQHVPLPPPRNEAELKAQIQVLEKRCLALQVMTWGLFVTTLAALVILAILTHK